MIGLDTTAIIDFFKENQDLKLVLDGIEDKLATTIINYQEIMFGLNPKDDKHKLEKEWYEAFFNNLVILELDTNSAKKASEILWALKEKGNAVGSFDSMIAGILLANGANKIITKNVKHFEQIKGLEVIWY